jgi:hypothetical protein
VLICAAIKFWLEVRLIESKKRICIKKSGGMLGSGEKGHSESGEKGHFSVRKKGPTHQRLFYSDYWLLATMESSFTCLHS